MKSTMKHTSKYLVFGLLAVLAFFSLVPVNPATAQQRSITVIGEGTARATPETVSLSLSVSSQDATATTVFAKHNVEIARLKKALIDAGVNAKDITEGSLAMNPTYDYSQPGVAPKLVGYHLMTPLDVRLTDIASLPRILDVATQSGASNVTIGSFGMKKQDQLEEAATSSAISDAKDKAKELAEEIGATLGEIISVGNVEAGGARGMEEMEREGGGGFNMRALAKHVELKVVFSLK
jgi:uncharacterized protein YggE